MVNTLDGYPHEDRNPLNETAEKLGLYTLEEMEDMEEMRENFTCEAPVHPKDISSKIKQSTSRVIEEPNSDF